MKLYGSQNRLTNMLDSSENWGIIPKNEGTNVMYKSQWYDDGVEVEHMRHNQLERN